MGVEFRLRFAVTEQAAVTEAVRALRFAAETDRSPDVFDLHSNGGSSEYPDARGEVEPKGLYFCVNTQMGSGLLGELLARLVDQFGPITVSNWE